MLEFRQIQELSGIITKFGFMQAMENKEWLVFTSTHWDDRFHSESVTISNNHMGYRHSNLPSGSHMHSETPLEGTSTCRIQARCALSLAMPSTGLGGQQLPQTHSSFFRCRVTIKASVWLLCVTTSHSSGPWFPKILH